MAKYYRCISDNSYPYGFHPEIGKIYRCIHKEEDQTVDLDIKLEDFMPIKVKRRLPKIINYSSKDFVEVSKEEETIIDLLYGKI